MKQKYEQQMKKGVLEMLVLRLLSEGEKYGYQLISELKEKSGGMFLLKEGTLYPILHTLEKGGYLSSYQRQAPTGRTRKYYKLTRKGRQLLADKKSEWERFRQGVSDVLSGGAEALGLA